MSKRIMKLLLVASALLLGACSVDSGITGPSGTDQMDVRYDVHVNGNDNGRQDVTKNDRRKRYAMAAS